MPDYKEDILKNGFEQYTIPLKNDYEGKVVSTLIRRLSPDSNKAVLYIHGFNDYFFQQEMATEFNRHGMNFYALDLRKYGRSYLPHQKFNDIRSLKDYYEEIKQGLNIIHNEGNKTVILCGHSTGGLLATLFIKDHLDKELFDGIILNSPFYEFNVPFYEKLLIPIASFIGKFFPRIKIPGGFSEEYGKSIHKDFYGEWDYILDWKPNIAPYVNLGWIRAIHQGQKMLRKTFNIEKPVLVLHSSHSVTDNKDRSQIQTMDAILNVSQIEHIARNIDGDVEIIPISGGLHDLILSRKDVRNHVYGVIFDWIKRHNYNFRYEK